MINELTIRFIEKVKAEKPNLTELAKEMGVKYDRMYKWLQGKGNPKPPDDKAVENWINGISSNNTVESSKSTTNMHSNNHTEKLIEQLEKHNKHLENYNELLVKKIEANLETLQKNQITHAAMCSSYLEKILELLAEQGGKDLQKTLNTVYNAEVEKMLEYNRMGNVLQIDSDRTK